MATRGHVNAKLFNVMKKTHDLINGLTESYKKAVQYYQGLSAVPVCSYYSTRNYLYSQVKKVTYIGLEQWNEFHHGRVHSNPQYEKVKGRRENSVFDIVVILGKPCVVASF